jgi:hypothetical protein
MFWVGHYLHAWMQQLVATLFVLAQHKQLPLPSSMTIVQVFFED